MLRKLTAQFNVEIRVARQALLDCGNHPDLITLVGMGFTAPVSLAAWLTCRRTHSRADTHTEASSTLTSTCSDPRSFQNTVRALIACNGDGSDAMAMLIEGLNEATPTGPQANTSFSAPAPGRTVAAKHLNPKSGETSAGERAGAGPGPGLRPVAGCKHAPLERTVMTACLHGP